MRILMLSQFYPPIIGGEEQHVRTLSIELVLRGHHVVVVTLRNQDLPPFELDSGVRVYRIRSFMQQIPWLFSDSSRQFAPPFPDPRATFELSRIIQDENPEIIHAHNWLVHSFLPLKYWSKARLIVTLHNYNLVCAKTSLMYRSTFCDGPHIQKCIRCTTDHYGLIKGTPIVLSTWMMGLIEREAVDMFLTVSQAVATNSGLVGSRQPFKVIPNFMPSDANTTQGDSQPYLSQLPVDDYLLFVGALNRQKGVDILLRAYKDITNAPPLVLIGYQTPEWLSLSENLPDNVFVLNDWPHYAVLEAWRRSLIGLFPSVGPETFGIAAMEAMWAGRPVIASSIGGLVDLVVDGETGLLVQPGDLSALQQAIEHLLAHPSLRKRMGQVAQQKVLEFRASTVVPQIEQVYKQVLL